MDYRLQIQIDNRYIAIDLDTDIDKYRLIQININTYIHWDIKNGSLSHTKAKLPDFSLPPYL